MHVRVILRLLGLRYTQAYETIEISYMGKLSSFIKLVNSPVHVRSCIPWLPSAIPYLDVSIPPHLCEDYGNPPGRSVGNVHIPDGLHS